MKEITDPKIVIWDKGKPATSDVKEKKRLEGRTAVIDEVLKKMGYPEGYSKYEEYINEMIKEDFEKYTRFLERVNELSEERGV